MRGTPENQDLTCNLLGYFNFVTKEENHGRYAPAEGGGEGTGEGTEGGGGKGAGEGEGCRRRGNNWGVDT